MKNDFSVPKLEANRFLEKLGITNPADLVDLEAICNSEQIEVIPQVLSSSEGRIVFGKNHTSIFYRKNEIYPQRERFTIAHELGHYFLHKKKLTEKSCAAKDFMSWNDPRKVDDIEAEANEFASEFLIPTFMAIPRLANSFPAFQVATTISSEFGSSVTASLLKHLEVTRFASMVVFFSKGRILYHRRSKAMEEMRLYPLAGGLEKHTLAASCSTYSPDPAVRSIFSECWFGVDLNQYIVTEQANYFPKINLGVSVVNLEMK